MAGLLRWKERAARTTSSRKWLTAIASPYAKKSSPAPTFGCTSSPTYHEAEYAGMPSALVEGVRSALAM
eukprot:scaffold90921_cov36-Tisochrysis_lutea.AAC.1